ncbi:hypothetical protein EK21DRAFT_93973 [Setomelanomma holmii]|uniref:Uncharacterized protein n=1 Tax=Setomelanomma holmii TaxID=210430 RepID=A0A9P4GX66_9PLEO|nr:hypothetical protein EK21DRAFT_93973 [Setomelanomma holmii]
MASDASSSSRLPQPYRMSQRVASDGSVSLQESSTPTGSPLRPVADGSNYHGNNLVGDTVLPLRQYSAPGSPAITSHTTQGILPKTLLPSNSDNTRTSLATYPPPFQGSFYQSSSSSSSSSTPTRSDRNLPPSQLPKSTSGVFINHTHIPSRHGPCARIVNVPAPEIHPSLADSIERSPSSCVNRHASMPMQPMTGFGPTFGRKPFRSEHSATQSTTPLGSPQRLGHRRNKTTVSDMSTIISTVVAERTDLSFLPESMALIEPPIVEQLEAEERSARVSFAPTQLRYEYAMQTAVKRKPVSLSAKASDGVRTSDQPRRQLKPVADLVQPIQESTTPPGSPAMSEQAIAVTERPTHEGATSMYSTNSRSTVASDSWNAVDNVVESFVEAHQLKRKLSRADLKVGLRPAIADPELMDMDMVRKLYPLDEKVCAAQNVVVSDFAFVMRKAPVTAEGWANVQFAQAAHLEEPPNDDLQTEEPETISMDQECLLAELREEPEHYDNSEENETSTMPHNGQHLLPTTTYVPPPTTVRIIAEDAGSILGRASDNETHLFTDRPASSGAKVAHTSDAFDADDELSDDDERPYGDLYFPTYTYFKLPKTGAEKRSLPAAPHKRESSLNFLRRISAHLPKLARNRPTSAPAYTLNDDGLLNRDFQFPVAKPDHACVASAPLLVQDDGDEGDVSAKKHKRHVSLGRWLTKLSGQTGNGGADQKPKQSLLHRGAERVEKYIMRKGW